MLNGKKVDPEVSYTSGTIGKLLAFFRLVSREFLQFAIQ